MKSFFGSRGVVAEHVMGSSQTKRFNSLYALINDPVVRVSGWLLVDHYFGVREFEVTEELVTNSELYAAKQSAYQQYLSGQKNVR